MAQSRLPHTDPSVPSASAHTELVSYSQNGEDVRLWRVFRDVAHGFYVDVGAGDPWDGSVTRLFYDRGWSGVSVEPSPVHEELAAARPRDVTIRAVVGDVDGTVPFFVTHPITRRRPLTLSRRSTFRNVASTRSCVRAMKRARSTFSESTSEVPSATCSPPWTGRRTGLSSSSSRR